MEFLEGGETSFDSTVGDGIKPSEVVYTDPKKAVNAMFYAVEAGGTVQGLRVVAGEQLEDRVTVETVDVAGMAR